MNKYIINLIILIILITNKSFAIDTKAEQGIVIDFDTNEILFEKNSNEKTPPASMTKIMTVYAAFDRLKNTDLSINNECVVSAKAYNMGGSRTFLEINDKVTIDELLKGLDDGTVDVITSNHEPQDFDSKNCEFEKASFGIISQQTFFSNLVELSRKISFDKLLTKITVNPRNILGITNPEIKEGSYASLTIYDEKGSWDYNDSTNLSKSSNSPWMNWSLRGNVKGVVSGNKTNIL